MTEIQEGQVRVNVATLLEVAGKAALQVRGVRSEFDSLLRQMKVLISGENQPSRERIPVEAKDVVITIPLKIEESASFVAVAREVQKRVWETVYGELGLSLYKVNVEINEIEWL